jgi:hypothetical protein
MAFLEEITSRSVSQVPISGASGFSWGDLTPSETRRIKRHFERFLPSQGFRRDREVLLIDYAFTGKSIYSISFFFQFEMFPVKTLAIVSEYDYIKLASDIDTLDIDEKSILGMGLRMSRYDDASAYPSYGFSRILREDSSEPRPRVSKEYRELRAEIRAYIEKDTRLQKLLHKKCERELKNAS